MAFREGKTYNVINGGHEQHLIQALRVSRLWGPPQSLKNGRSSHVIFASHISHEEMKVAVVSKRDHYIFRFMSIGV
jgi:hypothetical protein